MTAQIHIFDKIKAEQLAYLNKNWQNITEQLNIPPKEAYLIFQQFEQHYREPHRKYHNLSHIYTMLQLADNEQNTILEPIMLKIAIWFHDIVYNAKRKDNEKKSADFARKVLGDYCNEEQLRLLEKMILSTQKHLPLSEFKDTLWLLDFDLAVLAAEPNVYASYKEAIRYEYRIFPDFVYRPGRRKV